MMAHRQTTILDRVRWTWSGWRAQQSPGEQSTGWIPYREERLRFVSLASHPNVGTLRRDLLGAA